MEEQQPEIFQQAEVQNSNTRPKAPSDGVRRGFVARYRKDYQIRMKGHERCYCGSGQMYKNCHKPILKRVGQYRG